VSARTLGVAFAPATTPSGDSSTARIVSLANVATTPASEGGPSVALIAGSAGGVVGLALLFGAWMFWPKKPQAGGSEPKGASPERAQPAPAASKDYFALERNKGGTKSGLPGEAAKLSACVPSALNPKPHTLHPNP
jgi:hypothetical protein